MSKSSVIKCQRKLVKRQFYDLTETPLKLNPNLLAICFKLEIHSVCHQMDMLVLYRLLHLVEGKSI